MSGFRQPDHLGQDDTPDLRVRCPIHGFIRFSKNERKIIDHPLYQRLRYIRQLALTELLYPGATHTRFEHSLGVMQVATLAFDKLAERKGDRFQETFGVVEIMRDRPLAKARQVLRLAALLHDLGHTCFSHAAEHVIHKDVGGHEALTQKLLLNEFGGDFGSVIDKLYFEGCAALVARVLRGSSGSLEPQLTVLHDIVSGEMDADRTDYLRRDAHHCGVDYGKFDHLRFLESLDLYEEGGSLEIAIHRDGIHVLEALILARYQMNTQVYYHRLRRLFDRYLQEYVKALGAEYFGTPDKVLEATDIGMLAQIEADARSDQGERGKWARRIRHRKFHRMIFYTGDAADAYDSKRAVQLFGSLKEQYPDVEFLLDKPIKPIGIHKLAKPGDQDESAPVLQLVRSAGNYVPVTVESQILRHIPKSFQAVRIFADLDGDDGTRRESIGNWAWTRWRELGG